MGRVTLITGGARSGKSAYGESMAQKSGGDHVLYVATAVITDDEIADRIKRHKERRPPEWATEERYKNMAGLADIEAFQSSETVLLDCIGFELDRLLYDVISDWDNPSKQEILTVENQLQKELNDLILLCKKEEKSLIIITNEVGDGLVPENRIGRLFRDMLGRANCFAASLSDSVVLMTCGIPLELKENR